MDNINSSTLNVLNRENKAAYEVNLRGAPRVTNTSTFTVCNLSVLAYANGFTLWHYKTATAPLADVLSNNFFADASDMMARGDMILVSYKDGGTVLCVAASDAGRVLVARMA